MRPYTVDLYGVLIGMLAIGVVGCRSDYRSAFAEQAIRPNQVDSTTRPLKTGAVERAPDSEFLWIPFASPSENDAKRDMLERLQKEGINTSGKNVAFANGP